MAVTLNTYLVQVQRLLHDTNAQFFTTAQLTDYVNAARDKSATDAMCVRTLQNFTLATGTESYAFSAFPSGANTITVLTMNVIFGNLKYQLPRVSWPFLSSRTRAFVGYQQMPLMFAIYGENSIVVGPVPDQNYAVELDSSILPNDLVDNTTVEQIPLSYTVPVPYYAAYLAKQYQQMWAEADGFLRDYKMKLREARAGAMQRVIGNIYSARS